eukprot:scaffold12110_cov58-Cyclotella_meneghiniana.AAC.3
MLFEDEESLRAEKEGETNDGENNNDTIETTAPTADKDVSGEEKSTYMELIRNLRSLLGIGSDDENNQNEKNKNIIDNNDESKLLLRTSAKDALTALFVTEINKQIGMNRYKTAEKIPVPISASDLDSCIDANVIPPTQRPDYKPTDIWSPSDCLIEIMSCFQRVADDASFSPLPEFDKDDEMAMRFVTAACNLRSYVFQIERQSLYDAKGIAGNIIPAIATTNAIVAGLQVLQAFHILKCQYMHGDDKEEVGKGIKKMCRYTYCLREKTRKGYLLQPTQLPAPNPNCFVCRNAIISLALNTKEWTLEMLLTGVIKKELGFGQPTILVGGDIVYEEGDDIDPTEYAANLPKKLINLPSGGIGHGIVFGVEDFSQDLEVEVSVTHKDEWFLTVEGDGDSNKKEVKPDDREEIDKFEIGGKKPVVTAPTKAVAESGDSDTKESAPKDDDFEIVEPVDGNNKKESANNDDDSDIEIIEVATPSSKAAPATNGSASRMPLKKRRMDWEEKEDQTAKKIKAGPTG